MSKEDFKLCECECGEVIPAIRTDGKPARFKHGHNKGHYKGLVVRGVYVKKLISRKDGKKVYRSYHRTAYEQYYKCSLLPITDIHHKDGNTLNNDIKNLEPHFHNEHTFHHWRNGKRHSKQKKL